MTSGDRCPKCNHGWLRFRTGRPSRDGEHYYRYLKCSEKECDFEDDPVIAPPGSIRPRMKRSGNLPPNNLAFS